MVISTENLLGTRQFQWICKLVSVDEEKQVGFHAAFCEIFVC